MNKFILLFLLQGAALPAHAQFETADQLQVNMTPSISFNSSSGTFTYVYQVTSALTSVQPLKKLYLVTLDAENDDGGTISRIFGPTNLTTWRGGASNDIRLRAYTVRWYPADKTTQDDLLHPHPPSQALQPGQSLTSLGMISTFLPGPTTFYAQGWVMPPTQAQIDAKLGLTPADEPSGKQLQSVHPGARSIADNSFHGTTIGPMQAPTSLSASDLIARLIALKHQAASSGWISGPGSDGVVQSLDAKLSAAQSSVARGDNKTAANQLNAFINELQAQRGKHLNDNAFFLLQANAQFIVLKLGP